MRSQAIGDTRSCARSRAESCARKPCKWRHGRTRARAPEYDGMPLARIAWLTTVMVALVTAVLLLLEGYTGYAALSVAVGASASINLF